MARPRKCRRVCRFPQTLRFVPSEREGSASEIILTVDEYETIRLIDREGLSQEDCGRRMAVARTTVQQIYADARKKLADMLVEGRPLLIDGGDFRLCDGTPGHPGCGGCFKEQLNRQIRQKGDYTMRIAVTYENGTIFQHFGHTEQFKLYDVEDGKIRSSQVVNTNGSGHGALADILAAVGADTLICGGIGGGAQNALAAAGIKLYAGVSGSADQAVEDLLAGTLGYNPDIKCSHHEDHHHGPCGEHGCGEHRCEHE